MTEFKSQGLDLLEEWPCANIQKRVTFSEYSSKRVYKCSQTYRSNMSYTSAEIKAFQNDAAQEGLRIHHLISLYPLKKGSAIHHLIQQNHLSSEELLGIEHLIGKEAAVCKWYDIRTHVKTILMIQKRIHERNEESVDKLAQMATERSGKSVRQAQLRASLAL